MRAPLIKLASAFDVDVSKRARHAVLVDALMENRSAKLPAVLEELTRDELQYICEMHGLDRSGRAKALIIARILDQESTPVAKRTIKSKPRKKTSAPKLAQSEPHPVPPRQRELPLERVELSKLGSHLWEAANILRGSPVDRTDWKSYILPLLFFKRICDVWDEERDDMLEKYDGKVFPDDFRFKVPDDTCLSPCTEHTGGESCRVSCHWEAVRGVSKNVGKAIRDAMRGIEQANQDKLLGVFGDASWTNKERLPDDLIKDLLEHFSECRRRSESA